MAEILGSETLTKLFELVPGIFLVMRINPANGRREWLHASLKAAEIFGLSFDDMRQDPDALLSQLAPEDRTRLEAQLAQSAKTLAPMSWEGRVERGEGQVRWVEALSNFQREADGSLLWCAQLFDVSRRKEAEQALAESEATRAKSENLYRQVIDKLPVGIMVVNQEREFVIFNPAHERVVGGIADLDASDVSRTYGLFMADGKTPLPTEDTGMARGLRGESLEEEVVVRNPRLSADVLLRVVWTPLRDENGKVSSALGAAQDITLQRALESELRTRNEQLAASEAAKSELIERLRFAIDELSNPILEVWEGVLAMPLIGVIDSRRAADMVQRLLAEVTRAQADFVIMDLTGVDMVDTKTADHLIKLMRKVELVGARCVLTGIRPAVAETLVEIGVDFGRLSTLRNLKHGLREALRRNESDEPARPELDQDTDEEPQLRQPDHKRQ